MLAVGALAVGGWWARRRHTAAPAPALHDGAPATEDQPAPDPFTDASSRGGFAGWYGGHPLHLVVVTLSLCLTGYVVSLLIGTPDVARIAVWFVAAVVFHDLVLFPLYAFADRGASVLLRRRGASAVNHLRLPALASGILLLIYFPAILQQGEATYTRASGLSAGTDYLRSWLLLTAAFFAVSAITYAARVRRPGQAR